MSMDDEMPSDYPNTDDGVVDEESLAIPAPTILALTAAPSSGLPLDPISPMEHGFMGAEIFTETGKDRRESPRVEHAPENDEMGEDGVYEKTFKQDEKGASRKIYRIPSKPLTKGTLTLAPASKQEKPGLAVVERNEFQQAPSVGRGTSDDGTATPLAPASLIHNTTVVANPITQEALEEEFREGNKPIAVAKEGTGSSKRTKLLLAVAVFLIVLVAGVVIGVVVGNRDSSASEPESPTIAPTGVPSSAPSFGSDAQGLLAFVIENGSNVTAEDRDSPQAKALNWLIEDLRFRDEPLPDKRILQRYGLATFYFSTGGPSWQSQQDFLSPRDEWEWACPNPPGCTETSATIVLSQNNLDGTIPDVEMGYLADMLVGLSLAENNLQGPLPDGLFKLSNLESIDLSFNNGLNGSSIPESIVGWESMRTMLLSTCAAEGCGLVGPIPTSIGTLKRLRLLKLSFNNFRSSLPSEIGSLKRLETLLFSQAGITGVLPTEIGNLESLDVLEGNDNIMRSTLPTELGQLSFLRVIRLASRGGLLGTIPSELGNLHFLNTLDVNMRLGGELSPTDANNTLGGQIPGELFSGATKLEILVLAHGRYTGTFPTEIGLLTDLQLLRYDFWKSDSFDGGIPSEIGNLASLQQWTQEGAPIASTIPTEIGKMSRLEVFACHNSKMFGPLPSELGVLPVLRSLNVGSASLSGNIPTELGRLSNANRLHLENNRFTGSIPSEIGVMGIDEVSFRYNQLTGEIPTELGMLEKVKEIDFESNLLTGGIPTQLAQLTKMQQVSFKLNSFIGTVPTEFARLSSLMYMSVARTNVTGTIPVCGIPEVRVRADCLPGPDGVAEVSCHCCEQCCLDALPEECPSPVGPGGSRGGPGGGGSDSGGRPGEGGPPPGRPPPGGGPPGGGGTPPEGGGPPPGGSRAAEEQPNGRALRQRVRR